MNVDVGGRRRMQLHDPFILVKEQGSNHAHFFPCGSAGVMLIELRPEVFNMHRDMIPFISIRTNDTGSPVARDRNVKAPVETIGWSAVIISRTHNDAELFYLWWHFIFHDKKGASGFSRGRTGQGVCPTGCAKGVKV
jgi:hypothetical protein